MPLRADASPSPRQTTSRLRRGLRGLSKKSSELAGAVSASSIKDTAAADGAPVGPTSEESCNIWPLAAPRSRTRGDLFDNQDRRGPGEQRSKRGRRPTGPARKLG